MTYTKYTVKLVREPRCEYDSTPPEISVCNHHQVAKVVRTVHDPLSCPGEVVGLLCLDTANNIIGCHDLARGVVGQCAVYPRDIIVRALLNNAAAIILWHTHPAGTLLPSDRDWVLTEKVKQIAKDMEMPLFDHVIITETDSVSMKQYPRW